MSDKQHAHQLLDQLASSQLLAEFGFTMADWEKMAVDPEPAPRLNGKAHRLDRSAA